MGSEQFSELVPWLMTNLRSEGSAVERSGAAQVGAGREEGEVGGDGSNADFVGPRRRIQVV
jgi:hypothetical protein